MKTVEDLKKMLEGLPDNLTVGLYSSLDEGADLLKGIQITTKENHPYCKSDDLFNIYGEENLGTTILLLK